MSSPGEQGSALVPAISMLAALGLLSAMAIMAGGADLTLSTRLARERAAFYAAESALTTTLSELEEAGAGLPEETFSAPWPAPGLPIHRWRDGAWSCSRSVALVPDARDADGDPATTVVLFDRSFGYADSPRERGGYPLVQLLVTAESGEGRRGVVAEVAPVTCAPRLDAAWTAAGPLELSGDIAVAGAPPAVVGRGPVLLGEGAAVSGGIAVDPLLALPDEPLSVLAAGASLRRLEDLPAPVPDVVRSGIAWSRGDFAGSLEGGGILVVHNPRFDPLKHEASRLAIEEGVFLEGRDPAYSHLDPARQPARLEILRGGSFRGVIVADTIGSCGADFTLTGALVTLSRSPQTLTARAPLRLTHSREAIAGAGRGPLRHLVAFRPLAAAGQPPP